MEYKQGEINTFNYQNLKAYNYVLSNSVTLLDNTNVKTVGLTNTSQTTFPNLARLNGISFSVGSTAYHIDEIAIGLGYNASVTASLKSSLYELGPSVTIPTNASTPIYTQIFTNLNVTTTAQYFSLSPTNWNLEPSKRYGLAFQLSDQGSSFTGNFAFKWNGTEPISIIPTAPSVAQVLAGQDNSCSSAIKSGNATVSTDDFSNTFSITGLSANTSYDIYVVAENNESTPNVMASPTKISVKTPIVFDFESGINGDNSKHYEFYD